MRITCTVLLFPIVFAARLDAQGVKTGEDEVEVGQLVRVELDSMRREGTLLSVTPESLVLRRPVPHGINKYDTITVPQSLISRLSVVTSEHRHTMEGALMGMLVGGIVGYQVGRNSEPCEPSGTLFSPGTICWFKPTTRTGMAQLGAVVGGSLGMSLGGLLGYAWVSRTWQEVMPPR